MSRNFSELIKKKPTQKENELAHEVSFPKVVPSLITILMKHKGIFPGDHYIVISLPTALLFPPMFYKILRKWSLSWISFPYSSFLNP